MLRRLIERGVGNVALGPLWDPGAVAHCFAAGEGARPLRIGGKTRRRPAIRWTSRRSC